LLDEAEALRIVKPFNRSGCRRHNYYLFKHEYFRPQHETNIARSAATTYEKQVVLLKRNIETST
jgi:hypothetical protein